MKTDRASMAHSLEARVPFCDPEVAELALALPRSMKVRRLAKKRLLRDAVARPAPAARSCAAASRASRSRPPPGCAATWSRSPATCCRRTALRAQGFFEPGDGHRACSTAHVARKEDLSRQIWGLLMFSLWHDRYVGSRQRRRRDGELRNCELRTDADLLDAILAFSLALVVVWIATPVVKALAWRIGAIDEPRARGLHQMPTARLGGLAILAGVARVRARVPARRTSRRPAS